MILIGKAEREPFSNTLEQSVLPKTLCPWEKLFNQTLTSWDLIKPCGRKTLNSASLSFLKRKGK